MNDKIMGDMLGDAFNESKNHKHPIKKSKIAYKKAHNSTQKPKSTKKNSSKADRKPKVSKAKDKSQNSAKPNHQLLWNMQADVRAIGKLEALKDIYGLKNRTQALDLLYKTCLDKLIKQVKIDDPKAMFKSCYNAFMLKSKPKAVKRYKKQVERNKTK